MNNIFTDKSDRELIVTKARTKNSKIFKEGLDNIIEYKAKLKQKQDNSQAKIIELTNKLSALDTEYIVEADEKAAEKIATQRKSIRADIEDLKSIINTDYNFAIDKMLLDLEGVKEAADEEMADIASAISERATEYRAAQKEIDNKIMGLNLVRSDLDYSKAMYNLRVLGKEDFI